MSKTAGSSAKKRTNLAATLGYERSVALAEAAAGGWQTIDEIRSTLRSEGMGFSRTRVDERIREKWREGVLERKRLHDGQRSCYVYRAVGKKHGSLAATLGYERGVTVAEAAKGGWQTIEELRSDLRSESIVLCRQQVFERTRTACQEGAMERIRLYRGTGRCYVYRAKEAKSCGSSVKKRSSLAATLGYERGVMLADAAAGGWQTATEIASDLRGEGVLLTRPRGIEKCILMAWQEGALERARLYGGTRPRYVYRAKEGGR